MVVVPSANDAGAGVTVRKIEPTSVTAHADFDIAANDSAVLLDNPINQTVVNLPAASAFGARLLVIRFTSDTSSATFIAASGNSIVPTGANSWSYAFQVGSVSFICDGVSTWYRVGFDSNPS